VVARYLLDTNTASYLIEGNVPAVRRRLIRHPMSDIAISSITKGEWAYDELLLRLTILPGDSDAAALEQQGQPLGPLDMMIVSHALSSGLILVTNDGAFARISKLKIQDWTKTW
jgi:tRNA(fMet)-specific endonuclease VapC